MAYHAPLLHRSIETCQANNLSRALTKTTAAQAPQNIARPHHRRDRPITNQLAASHPDHNHRLSTRILKEEYPKICLDSHCHQRLRCSKGPIGFPLCTIHRQDHPIPEHHLLHSQSGMDLGLHTHQQEQRALVSRGPRDQDQALLPLPTQGPMVLPHPSTNRTIRTTSNSHPIAKFLMDFHLVHYHQEAFLHDHHRNPKSERVLPLVLSRHSTLTMISRVMHRLFLLSPVDTLLMVIISFREAVLMAICMLRSLAPYYHHCRLLLVPYRWLNRLLMNRVLLILLWRKHPSRRDQSHLLYQLR